MNIRKIDKFDKNNIRSCRRKTTVAPKTVPPRGGAGNW